jgi:release factor glutamine methyltransferase
MTDRGPPWTVKRLLEWTAPYLARRDVDSPRLSAELLLSHVLGVPRIKLYTDFERVVSDANLAAFRTLVQRAADQEPVAYLTGTAHFFNLELHVSRDVLIPRPDTETLVENVLQLARNTGGFESPRVLDLCTGSGCIAAAIAKHLKNAVVVAVDNSAGAVKVARENLRGLDLLDRVTVEHGDLFEPLARLIDARPFDLIVANPPYIATAKIETLDRSVRDYEPLAALDGGLDGLTLHRRILEGAPQHLRAGGRVYLEIAFDQAEAALDVVHRHTDQLEDARILKDNAGNDRVLTARRRS